MEALPVETVSLRFKYRGSVRHVDTVKLEDSYKSFVGMEIRKGGRFSWQIKRFKLNRVESAIEVIEPQLSEKQYLSLIKSGILSG